jgi:DNA gyrase subunit A
MPLPEDEARWDEMYVMFATASGYVRRNKLSDFSSVLANGKIAMKLEDGDRLVGVLTCSEADDVLLAARGGKSIRFPVPDVRVFTGRTSMGVRGIKLEDGDQVVSMSILRHVDADTVERDAYLRLAAAKRRAAGEANGDESNEDEPSGDEPNGDEAEPEIAAEDAGVVVPPERLAALEAAEEFILTVTEKGYGKRTSAYEYRITGRGGQGIANIEKSERNGPVVASFPVAHRDQIMLMTDGGQLIRCPVDDIRIAGRKTQGVVIFKVAEGERVVSVTGLAEEESAAEETAPEETAPEETGGDPSPEDAGEGGDGNAG